MIKQNLLIMKNNQWKSYFIFSKKERIAVTILLLLIVVFAIFPYFWPIPKNTVAIDGETAGKVEQLQQTKLHNATVMADSANKSDHEVELRQSPISFNQKKDILFYFDPNTLDDEGWKRLGVKEKTIATIRKYISKGGHFKQPDDIRKIYGLQKEQADALIPYVKMNQPLTKLEKKSLQEKASSIVAIKKVEQIQSININTATEEEWKALPGIGEVLSKRIVKFRTKLKGFISIQQVGKTYGLADSVYQKLLPYLRLENTP